MRMPGLPRAHGESSMMRWVRKSDRSPTGTFRKKIQRQLVWSVM